jgi:hypothetical protein
VSKKRCVNSKNPHYKRREGYKKEIQYCKKKIPSHFLHIKTCPKSNVTYLKHLCCCWLEEEQNDNAISISFDLQQLLGL